MNSATLLLHLTQFLEVCTSELHCHLQSTLIIDWD